MKRLLGAVVGLALIASQANALSLGQGDITIQLLDATSFYTDVNTPRVPTTPSNSNFIPSGDSRWSSLPSGYASSAIAVGDEMRSVFDITKINYPADSSQNLNLTPGRLTGLTYGLTLQNISPDGFGGQNLSFTGGHMQLWYDPTPLDGASSKSSADVADPFGDGFGSKAWASSGLYPKINFNDDAVLFLDCEFVPYTANSTATMVATLDTDAGTGALTRGGYLKIVGGEAQNLFDQNIVDLPSGETADLYLSSTLMGPNNGFYWNSSEAYQGFWQLASTDPITGSVIPEPATMTLLGLGLAGLAAARRRARK